MPRAKKESASTRVVKVEGESMTGEELMIRCHNQGMGSGAIERVYGHLLGVKASAISTAITKLIEHGDERITRGRRDNITTISLGRGYTAVAVGRGEQINVQRGSSEDKPEDPGL